MGVSLNKQSPKIDVNVRKGEWGVSHMQTKAATEKG